MKKGGEFYMKKRVFAIALVIVLALTLAVSAAEMRAMRVKPTLSFSGTTAYCDVLVSEANTYVEVTLELWRGSTLIDSWSASGLGRAVISETASVESGKSYHLEANGTIGGTPFSAVSKTYTCP